MKEAREVHRAARELVKQGISPAHQRQADKRERIAHGEAERRAAAGAIRNGGGRRLEHGRDRKGRAWAAGTARAKVVGAITIMGMLLLNVRLALLLGFMAGALTFIPYLGSILSLIPAVLIALLNGPATALYVAVLYLGAHITEGYILTPLIQGEVVHLAPGWLIMAQLFGYLLAGVFGMATATPVAVVLTIVVQMLYLQDVLGDHVRLLGN